MLPLWIKVDLHFKINSSMHKMLQLSRPALSDQGGKRRIKNPSQTYSPSLPSFSPQMGPLCTLPLHDQH